MTGSKLGGWGLTTINQYQPLFTTMMTACSWGGHEDAAWDCWMHLDADFPRSSDQTLGTGPFFGIFSDNSTHAGLIPP